MTVVLSRATLIHLIIFAIPAQRNVTHVLTRLSAAAVTPPRASGSSIVQTARVYQDTLKLGHMFVELASMAVVHV